jgi:hypothetical protein
MKTIAARAALALTVLWLGGRALADDHIILGRKILIRDPSGDPLRRKVVGLGKEVLSNDAVVGNPVTSGATLTVFTTGGTGVEQSFALPAAGWRPVSVLGFTYTNRLIGGPVRKAVIKRTAGGTFTLSVTVTGAGGSLAVVPPNPGESGGFVLEIGAGDRYCVTLGGAAGGLETRDDALLWQVKNAVAEVCGTTFPTTTTTSTSSSSSTSSTSTSSTTSSTSTATSTTSSSTSTSSSTTSSTSSTTSTSTSTTSSTSTTETTTSTSTSSSTSSTSTSSSTTTTSTSSTSTTTLAVEVNLLYVHGLKNCTSDRQNAQNSLDELETAVNAALPARIASWQAAHPNTVLTVSSARANVYTAAPSGIHPSDSTDPLLMDDWEVGDPGCSATTQGDPCTTAYEWRYRLAEEINEKFPPPAKNVVLIGHSAGARVAMEVAANVGSGGVGSHDWGVQSRIAGVVTVQGMVDQLGSSKYDVVGISSFESSCKFGDAIVGFGESCAPGNGFCEWAARIDGFPAADWVAKNKRSLMLTAWGSCSPSAWAGRSDGSLPYDAQGSPWAVGLDMTPAPGETWRPSHGQNYGSFCHSAVVKASDPNHATARDSARNRILDWLFVAAPRVANTGSDTTPSISFNDFSATFTMGSSCPAGDQDDTVTTGNKGPGLDVVGVCKHPGFFDGDDHAIALSEFTVTNGATCSGTYKWKQAHDSDNPHAATFWWKTRSVRASGPDLIDSLPTS